MMASNVSAEQSVTGARQVFLIPTRHQQKITLSHATCCTYILPAEAAIIYFHNSDILPLPTTIKRSCTEEIKIKFDIALRQNCDQCASMLGNAEFCMTLEGRRMAPYLEQERGQ